MLAYGIKRCTMIGKILLSFCCAILVLGCSDKVEPVITYGDPLQASPNPMNEVAYVYLSIPSAAILLAFDPTGKLIFEQPVSGGNNQIMIDVSQGPPGKYQFVCKVGSMVYSKTLLKI